MMVFRSPYSVIWGRIVNSQSGFSDSVKTLQYLSVLTPLPLNTTPHPPPPLQFYDSENISTLAYPLSKKHLQETKKIKTC